MGTETDIAKLCGKVDPIAERCQVQATAAHYKDTAERVMYCNIGPVAGAKAKYLHTYLR